MWQCRQEPGGLLPRAQAHVLQAPGVLCFLPTPDPVASVPCHLQPPLRGVLLSQQRNARLCFPSGPGEASSSPPLPCLAPPPPAPELTATAGES